MQLPRPLYVKWSGRNLHISAVKKRTKENSEPKLTERVFRPFTRSERATRTPESGAGAKHGTLDKTIQGCGTMRRGA
jgi:hypothetical protein